MNFASYLARYPNVRLATPADNPRLLAFYSKVGMQGGAFQVRFEKAPDYFRFLGYESDQGHVVVSENDAGEVEGLFALSTRLCYLSGQKGSVIYASDLRFVSKQERKSRFSWKGFAFDFLGEMHTVDEFKGIRHLIVTVIAANKRARESFSSAKAPFATRPIDSYRMVNLLARKPFRWRRIGRRAGIQVSHGQQSDRVALSAFLDAQNRKRTFGYVFEGETNELARRLRSWDGFTMESFLIARDQGGDIIGCFATWDPSAGRRIVLTQYHPILSAVSAILAPFSRRVPRPGNPLRILYLTTFEVASNLPQATRAMVVNALLEALRDRDDAKKSQMMAICDYDADSFLPQLKAHYFSMQTPTVVCQLCHHDDPQIGRDSASRSHLGHELCIS